jgi:hypothetical protein
MTRDVRGFLALLSILWATAPCSAGPLGGGGFARGIGAIAYSNRDTVNDLDSYTRVDWNSSPNYDASPRGGNAGPLSVAGNTSRSYATSGGFGNAATPTLGDSTTRLPGYGAYGTPARYGSILSADAELGSTGAGASQPAPRVDGRGHGAVTRSPLSKAAGGAGRDGEDALAGYAGPPDARPLAALPAGYVPTVWKGGAYYHLGLSFYRPYWYEGEVQYWPVYPPIGWVFKDLPPGSKASIVQGRTYYRIEDVWMQESVQNGQIGWAVAANPFQVEFPSELSPGKEAPDPFQVLRKMSDYLARQPHFMMSVAVTCDRVNPTGQRVQLSRHCELYFERPGKVAADVRYGDKSQRLVLDSGLLTLIDPVSNSYGTVSLPATADEALDTLAKEYGTIMPSGDLLYSDIYERVARKAQAGRYIGREKVADRVCDHLSFRQEAVGCQIWVESGDAPIPRKIVIRYDRLPAQPRYELQIDTWSTEPIAASRFQPNLPAGAAKVDVLAAGSRSPAGR